ncbi:replication factor A protein 3 [Sparassis latifolia]
MADHVSPRVNSARLADHIKQTVRLTCKTLKFKGDTAIVQASDGGEVEIKLLREANMTKQYVEVIGQVVDASTIRMMSCINLGDELDMNLVNDVVEVWHDPKFSRMF